MTVTAPSASRAWNRRAAGVLAACVALSGVLLAPGAARGAPLSDCSATHGTIVAVDFGHWGGPIVRGCGIGQPTGYALLHAAGFTTAGDAQDGNVFICRLGDAAFRHGTQYPTPSEDPCVVTPPGTAYWSFWIAPAGKNTWAYSSLGPLGVVPKAGEVELWKFGGTKIGGTSGSGVPHYSPNTLRPAAATATTHTTTSTTTTTTQAAAPSRTPTAPAKHTGAARRAAVRPRRHSHPRRSTHPHPPSASRTTTAPAPSHTGVPVVAAQPTRTSASAGSPVALIVGGCLALALAAGGAWTAWRRRRFE